MIKTEKNKIFISLGEIEKLKGDVVLNWATNDFISGPISFFNLIKRSGFQPLEAIKTFKANIYTGGFKEGDALSTIPGQLDYNLIIHSLYGNSSYNLNWFNIINTLNEYKKNNVCRNLYITIPDWSNVIDFITNFLNYIELVEDIEFHFIVNDVYEKETLKSHIILLGEEIIVNPPILEKFVKKFLNFLYNISVKLVLMLFSKDGNNKKKLQKNPKRVRRLQIPFPK